MQSSYEQAPQMDCLDGLIKLWFCEPAGVIIKYCKPDQPWPLELSHFISTKIWPCLQRQFPESQDYYFIYDLQKTPQMAPGSAKHMVEWAKQIRPQVKSVVIVLDNNAPMLMKMATTVGETGLRLAGVNFKVVYDNHFWQVVNGLQLKPALKEINL